VALRTSNIFSYSSRRLTCVVLLFLNAFKASFNITAIGQISGRILVFWLIAALVSLPVTPAMADLRSAPVWYDQNAVTTGFQSMFLRAQPSMRRSRSTLISSP
jgi:hypothetical protein